MPGPLIAAGILAAIGGFMSAKNKADTALEAEKQKNARELVEANVVKPAIESGNTAIFDTYEKTLKEHYTKPQLDMLRAQADNNSQENKIKRMVQMLTAMQGAPGMGGAPGPSAPMAQPQIAGGGPQAPEPTALTGGSLGPTNPERPNPMPALGAIMQQDVTGQPSIGSLQNIAQSNQQDLQTAQQTGGSLTERRTGPVEDAQARLGITRGQSLPPGPEVMPRAAVPRLQPKVNMTLSKGEPSFNITPPTEQEQGVHQAQYLGAMEWVARNPQVQKAYGTQLTDRLRAGDPKALEQVIGLQKDPSVQPNVQDVLALEQIKDPTQKMVEATKLFGDPKKAVDYVVQHPPGDQIDMNQIKGDVEVEARALNAKAGRPQSFVDEATLRQAQNNVLKRAADVRAQTSKQTEDRMKELLTARASTGAIVKTAGELTKKLSDDTQFLSKAQMAIKYLAQAGDMIHKGGGGTGIRPVDATMREFQGYLQQGKTGEAAALMQGWSTDIALLEQRFFGASSRMAASIIDKQEQNVPNVKDKLSVFNAKLLRINDLFKKSEQYLGTRRDSAIKMLEANPYTKPAADAMRQGLYDASTGYLKNAGEAAAAEPLPTVNFGSGEFAPAGR